MEWIEIIEDDYKTTRPVRAKKLEVPEYPELRLYVHKAPVKGQWEEGDGYTVTEYSSGADFCRGIASEEFALPAVMDIINKHGIQEVKRKINEMCESIRQHQKVVSHGHSNVTEKA